MESYRVEQRGDGLFMYKVLTHLRGNSAFGQGSEYILVAHEECQGLVLLLARADARVETIYWFNRSRTGGKVWADKLRGES